RALLAAESEGIDLAANLIRPIAVLATEPTMTKLAFAVSAELRQAGFVVDQVTNAKNLKTGLKIAARLGAAAAVIIGPDEVATGVYAVKMLDSGVQITAGLGELGSVIAQHLALDTKAT
ncbi:MAG: His/Gly/Thr/Pro-type tRNA ligase C-terminal domain-containing protein, partial [Actinomycetota bacterium]|nr:His/Gly/Thr/Pro-type tRNA ligase C-terminal domain-containing protein [Actinomycetota bacterium]